MLEMVETANCGVVFISEMNMRVIFLMNAQYYMLYKLIHSIRRATRHII